MSGDIDPTSMQRFPDRAEGALPRRVTRAVLFGSRARGDARPGSDRDAAVFVTGRASGRDTLALADAAYDPIVETGETIHPLALSEGGKGTSMVPIDHITAEGIRL